MLVGIVQLPFECLETPAQNLRLGGIEQGSQTLQPRLLRQREIDLYRFTALHPSFMMSFHDVMIVFVEATSKAGATHRSASRRDRVGDLSWYPHPGGCMTAVSRRDFARLLALSGSTAFWPSALPSPRGDWLRELGLTDAPLPRT